MDASYKVRSSKILAMLIEKKLIRALETVYYRSKKTGGRLAEGRITSNGIVCRCCGHTFNLSKFETHAGSTNHRPSSHLFLEDGRSISDCQLQLKQLTTGLGNTKKKDGLKKEQNLDRSLVMFGGVIACFRLWRNWDPDVYRFLSIFVSQNLFIVTFFLVIRLLNL